MSGFRHEFLVVSVFAENDDSGGCAPGHPDSNVCKPASPNTKSGTTQQVRGGFEADALELLLGDLD